MLPNRFSLSRQAEEKLKRDKLRSGTPPNIAARELFFRSIETGKVFKNLSLPDSGHMMLDKATWLGETETATLTILRNLYKNSQGSDLACAWSLHVEHGLELTP